MRVRVSFYSYFKDLAKCSDTEVELGNGDTVEDLLRAVFERYPRLAPMRGSMLIAVGLDYAPRDRVLAQGNEVSMFPPVQGG